MPDAKRQSPGGAGEPPDFAELLARAEALVPVLRERAGRTEELRRLPDETIDDLHRSGLFRILQPKRVGGSELPFREALGMRKIHFDHVDHRVLPKPNPRASRASAAFLPPGGYIIDDLAARQRRG